MKRKATRNVYGKNVFVTGASSGIGEACARIFAQNGCTVTGVSRNIEEKTETFPGGGSITTHRLDVTDEAAVRAFVGQLQVVDIAVLCAGMGVAGPGVGKGAEEGADSTAAQSTDKSAAGGQVYGDLITRSVAKMEADEQNGRSPDSVARVALALAGRKDPPARVPVGLEYKALMLLLRVMPDRGKEFILRKMYLPEK